MRVSISFLVCLLALAASQPTPDSLHTRVAAKRKAQQVVAAYVPDYRMASIDWPGLGPLLYSVMDTPLFLMTSLSSSLVLMTSLKLSGAMRYPSSPRPPAPAHTLRLTSACILITAEHLTDIILFSVEISPGGDIVGLDRVQQGLVSAVQQKAAHRNLRVLLSIGGGGRSDGFIFVSKRSADRKSFVQKLVMLCNEQGLDGIDFDWEGMNFLQNRDMLTAYTQLLIQANKQFKKHHNIIIIITACNFVFLYISVSI